MKRMVLATLGVVTLTWGASAAYAATIPVDETISVPGFVPAAFVCVNADCREVDGVSDIKIQVQATAVAAEGTDIAGTTGANCARVDRKLTLNLTSSATGKVVVSYTETDAQTGATTLKTENIPFGGATPPQTPTEIKACVR